MPTDIALHTHYILILAGILGLAFGATLRATQFCTMGAISDVVLFGSWQRIHLLAMALGVAILGTHTLAYLGYIDLSHSLYTQPRLLWASHIVGGFCFGIGMVLAGGCGSQALVRLGSGSLKALIVLMVMAISANMALRGLLSGLRVYGLEPWSIILTTPNQMLPTVLGFNSIWVSSTIGSSLIVITLWHAQGHRFKTTLVGGVIGGFIVAAWFISGYLGYVPEDPDTLQAAFLGTGSKGIESMSFVAPIGAWLSYILLFSDNNQTINFGMLLALGIAIGSGMVACWQRTVCLDGFGGVRDLSQHLIGAALMGLGGVLGLGCSIGQGLSGLSTLSIGSILTVASMVLGAFLTLYHLDK